MGSMLKMRQALKSARVTASAEEMLQGTLGRQAYVCAGSKVGNGRKGTRQQVQLCHT